MPKTLTTKKPQENQQVGASALNTLLGDLPFPFDDDIKFILGRPNFVCGPIARLLSDSGGIECATKAEDEQALVLYWMLGLYMKHGKNWRTVLQNELEKLKSA